MKKPITNLIWVMVLASVCFLISPDVYQDPWLAVTTCLLFFTALPVLGDDKLLMLTLCFWLANTWFMGRHSAFAENQQIAKLSMLVVTMQSQIALIIIANFIFLYSKFSDVIRKALCAAFALELISLCSPWPIFGLNGLLGNTSIGLCYLSVLSFLLPNRLRTPASLLILGLSIYFHSATSFGALLAVLTIESWCYFGVSFFSSALAGGAGIFLLIKHVKPNLLADHDRYHIWKLALQDWWQNANIFFGYGHGTYKYLGPQIQFNASYFGPSGKDVYLWLHNDWLQILFEGGIVGFVLTVILFFAMAIRFYKRKKINELCCLICLAIVGLSQYPLELAAFTMIVIYLLMEYVGLKDEKEKA